MNTNPFDLFGYYDTIKDNNQDFYNIQMMDSSLFCESFSDDEIDELIMDELNTSMNELGQEIDGINDIFRTLSSMVSIQGEKLDQGEQNIEQSVVDTEIGVENLAEAEIESKNKFKIVRDVAMVVFGGICGTAGFLMGPVVGIGGVVAGLSLGSAAVYRTHKKIDKK